MNTQTRTDWGPTVRLATMMSILSALVGVVLVRLAGVPESVVVIGVMVVGCLISMTSGTRTRDVRPQLVRVRSRHERHAA